MSGCVTASKGQSSMYIILTLALNIAALNHVQEKATQENQITTSRMP